MACVYTKTKLGNHGHSVSINCFNMMEVLKVDYIMSLTVVY